MTGRSPPWAMIVAVLVVMLFAVAVFGYALLRGQANAARDAAVSGFVPSAGDQDPSARIPGVTERTYQGGQHVTPAEQVAYTGVRSDTEASTSGSGAGASSMGGGGS